MIVSHCCISKVSHTAGQRHYVSGDYHCYTPVLTFDQYLIAMVPLGIHSIYDH